MTSAWTIQSAGPGNLVGGAITFVEGSGSQGAVEYGLWLLLGLVGESSEAEAGLLTQLEFVLS